MFVLPDAHIIVLRIGEDQLDGRRITFDQLLNVLLYGQCTFHFGKWLILPITKILQQICENWGGNKNHVPHTTTKRTNLCLSARSIYPNVSMSIGHLHDYPFVYINVNGMQILNVEIALLKYRFSRCFFFFFVAFSFCSSSNSRTHKYTHTAIFHK